VTTQLYINGAEKLPIAFISGHYVQSDPHHPNNIGIDNNDTLWMRSGQNSNAIIWDDLTTNTNNPVSGPAYTNLYGASRYGLPGGQPGQENASFEYIRGGDDRGGAGFADDVISDDFINLSYSSLSGGVAYNLAVTIDVGAGRDLVVSGEGNDVIYGGDENKSLGDGLLGMGGNDTIYGGFNFSIGDGATIAGSDDLFGYAGDDTLYGFNQGDVMYGDAGNDVIFMPRSALGANDVGGFANPGAGSIVQPFETATAFGGDGNDTIVASGLGGSNNAGVRNREYFIGGNVPAQWSDAEYFLTPNGQDTGQDTVDYSFNVGFFDTITNTQKGVIVDLNMTQPDPGDFLGPWGTGAGGALNDRFYGIEHLVGSSLADTIFGSAVGNNLFGGAGAVSDTLYGAAGSDMLIGGDGNDSVDAGADNDLVEGGVGADTLSGGTGSDTLSYSLSGSAVNVTLGESGASPVSSGGDAAGDVVDGTFENLLGSAFNDTLIGNSGVNAIFGIGGDDFIQGGAAGDSLSGGAGKDTLSYSTSDAGVNVTLGGGGTGGHAQGDTVVADFEVLLGSGFNDTLQGSNDLTAHTIIGGTGDDTIEGRGGADSLDGGAGTGDFLSYANSASAVNVTLSGGILANGDAAGDTVANFENLLGSAFNDGLTGTTLASNTIYGGGGNDSVDGLTGNDTLYGGTGSDFAIYGNSASSVVVNLATNTATGGLDNDALFEIENVLGSNSNDTLTGNGVSNILIGSLGVDTLNGGALGDTLVGGTATGAAGQGDWVSYAGSAAGVTVDLGVNTQAGTGDSTGDVLFGLQHLVGSSQNDTLTGNSAINTVLGGLGVDTVAGGAGADILAGGTAAGAAGQGDFLSYAGSAAGVTVSLALAVQAGGGDATGDATTGFQHLIGSGQNDTLTGDGAANSLVGGLGVDTIISGAGADTLVGGTVFGAAGQGDWAYYHLSSAVTIDLNLLGAQTSGGDASGDVLSGIQHLFGTNQADVFTGNALANSLIGNNGNDTIYGGNDLAGGDMIFGDDTGNVLSGNDRLFGGGGTDTIYGGLQNDFVEGGVGADSLSGGAGTDTLSYSGSASFVNVTLGGTGVNGDAQGDILAADFEVLEGSAHNDILAGDGNANTIFGGTGADSMLGNGGIDSVAGGLGNDTVEGGAGADILDGGNSGGDWVVYSGAGVTVDLGTILQVSGGDASGDSLTGFNNLRGTENNDSLLGSTGNNTILGGAGIDTIEGGLGNDVLDGRVSLSGANEGDWVSYRLAGAGVSASLFAGTATGGAGTDIIGGFQHILGSDHADFLEGDDDLDNSLVGGLGGDTLSGLGGIDTLFGGLGNDTIQLGNNGSTLLPATVFGWDGENNEEVEITIAANTARLGDYAFGGIGTDVLDISALTGGQTRTLFMRFNPDGTPSTDSNIPGFIAGMELIIAGASADIINLTFNDGVTRTAYAENVTIFGGENDDIILSGSGNDTIIGGLLGTATDGADTLFGGQGNDFIRGDNQELNNLAGADDRLFGGTGFDTVLGDGGNDVIVDNDGGLLFGGLGGDIVLLRGGDELSDYVAHGGLREDGGAVEINAGLDGNDQVFVGGNYNSVESDLGAGNDRFISSDDPSDLGLRTDVVRGGTGDDLVSAWFGDDLLYGDTPDEALVDGGHDVLWGGAGSDTIYGGPGDDYLYGGAGDGDVLVGGAGIDYYYWSRTDGDDLIDDNDPGPLPGTGAHVNAIIVFPDFDTTELSAGSDQLRTGTGVFETDGDLYDNVGGDDMVQIVDIDGGAGTMYRIDILTGAGAGSSMTFDQQDISVIALWNNDAAGGTPVITQYVWDDVDQRYELA
jgi:Ca2+-binding RTX toxin-like protein